VLQYGKNMPIPIADLEVTDAGVSATLSFSRVSHRTYVPWSAVYAVTCTNGCGVLFREDIPEDVALATPMDVGPVELPLRRQAACKQSSFSMSEDVPWLRVVSAEDEMETSGLAIHLHSRRRRPQLRVVK
jgi:stringent starvation protein B